MKTINAYYENFKNLENLISENHCFLYEMKPSCIFVQIFSVYDNRDYLVQIASEISGLIPHACIIGATADSAIMNGEICEQKTVLSFSIFYDSKVRCALLPKANNSDFALGAALASRLNSAQAKALIVFSAGLSLNAGELLSGIANVNPGLPVVGGKAGDPCHDKLAVLYCNGQITEAGVAGAVLEGELTVSQYWHLGWQPIGKAMTVTKADDLRVYTIDHQPAFAIYKKYLGLSETGEFGNAAEYPLIVNRDGIHLARVPVLHFADDSIAFGADIKEGETVWLSFGNVEMILDAVENLCTSIKQQPVESLFVYSCSCRRSFLQSLSKLETGPLQAIAPTAGFFASGEFFHIQNKNYLFNASITILALSEKKSGSLQKNPGDVIPYKKMPVDEKNRDDNKATKDAGVLKALTHLVNTVIVELEQAQTELQYNVIGEMAAGIGHEVRNPMTTVRGYLQMFQKKKEFSAYNRQLAIMIEELDRANLIITKFLSLSKHKRVEMKSGNINDVLNALFPLLQTDALQLGHAIRLETEPLPDFEFDDKEIRQLIINLVRNGLEAMDAAGMLAISTSGNDNYVLLRIQDTGPGIPREVMDKLGIPFVTTKDDGTGIGLSVCYRIAERHQAEIEFTTGEHGTAFIVKFNLPDRFSTS